MPSLPFFPNPSFPLLSSLFLLSLPFFLPLSPFTSSSLLPSPPSLPLPLCLPCRDMEWFSGGVPAAIAASRVNKTLFIVYVYGKLTNLACGPRKWSSALQGFSWVSCLITGCILCVCLCLRVQPLLSCLGSHSISLPTSLRF